MIIKANSNTNKTQILIKEYLALIKQGVEPQDILVIVQNSHKKKNFIEEIKKLSDLGNIGDLKIYSFFGLCYNFILDNWAIIENSIKSDDNRKIIPNLCGLEISQYIFKNCIKEVDFSGYNSKTSLLHQLLRRNALINFNDLTAEEIKNREQILKESYSKEASKAINKYKLETIDKRAFDYIRQINLFEFIYKRVKNSFKYVFLDDGDEIIPALYSYLEYIKPEVKEFFIAYDEFGSSRLGYLGAININFEEFLNEKSIPKDNNDKKTKNAQKLFNCVQNDELIELENIKTKSFLRRDEQIKAVLKDIKKLINDGVKPSEIVIITPLCNEYLKILLDSSGFNFNYLSKSEKLYQNKLISYILELLKIINEENNVFLSPYTLKGIFIELLGLDEKETLKIIQSYKIAYETQNTNIFELIKESKNEQFQKLIRLREKIRYESLSFQLYETVINFVDMTKKNSKDIIKINKLLKQIYDFEEIFKNSVSNSALITQLENTIISENPLEDDEIFENQIIVSTAQKIIDYSYKTKYQFLLDASCDLWIKQDIGPLYNAWVMQKKWNKESFELEDNIRLTKDKIARTLYKLYLLSQNITLYSSVYDEGGMENIFGIDKYYKYKNENINKTPQKPIIPRDDQKNVLNYKGGLMSVSATAGSGKTTILLLLVEKILNGEIIEKIEPKNIFVLTFMESAARNFREKIKDKYPNLSELPNISTIHGLALRILKENNNYSRIGFDFDFEIIDEIKRTSILSEILNTLGIDGTKLELYNSAISSYKNELAQDYNFISSNRLFLKIYEAYQEKLKSQNLIDYDDLLFLSLKLLRENEDILSYYQNLAKIIIEDEAQDSSAIQQNLIKLLGQKYKNIIRCGDINQAITSTFTNSDVKGFRDFMTKSQNVVMDKCQRCATGVLDCANNTVKIAKEDEINAFSSLIMKPVENVNIVDKNAVTLKNFEEEKEETDYIIKTIKKIIKDDPKASFAILLRSNFAIGKWDNILKENSIKTYRNSDSLVNNPVYKTVLLILEFINNPYDIKHLKETAKQLYDLGLYDYGTLKYAQNLNEPIFLRDDYDEQFFWDMNYFLYKNTLNIYEICHIIASYYFENTPQNPNIALVCAIAQKIQNTQKTFENTVSRLREIQFKNNFSNIKFFSCDEDDKKNSSVQIMTLHKSKGDEFDYVFIPELTNENLCFSEENFKLKENSKFIQKVKKFPKSDDILKREIIEENYRLIYVGITRAKKKLFLTVSNKYKYFAKMKEYKNSEIFERLEDLCQK